LYQALYRKWRPQVFSDVSGQPHVTVTLAHEVESGRLSHAYLFTGSRGTGKTTCAKILAKAINCLHPVGGNPCCECEICKGIDSGSVLDVIEIDAASNNGVDNIRDLREEASFTPVKAKYRVYIIDEVHMLSIGAFNALLKILEEPPSYVVFILATTEIQKLPATILSRCQRFDFKHIPPEDISERLLYVAEHEGIKLTSGAAVLIARIADGALRDALSLLDRCSARGGEITDAVVSECAGITGREYLFKMADFIKEGDTAGALRLVDELNKESCSMERLCSELLCHFRNLMISKTVSSAENLIICSKNELQELKSQSEGFTLENIFYVLSVLEETALNLRKGLDRRTETEMAVIRLCNASLRTDNSAILKRISDLEAAVKSGVHISAKPVISPADESDFNGDSEKADDNLKKTEAEKPEEPVVETTILPDVSSNKNDNPAEKAKSRKKPAEKQIEAVSPKNENCVDMQRLFGSWPEVLLALKDISKPLSGILVNSSAYVKDNVIYVKSQNAAFEQFLHLQTYSLALSEAVLKVTGQNYRIEVYNPDEGGEISENPLSRLIEKIDAIKNG
jgi:DNA polymerase-3 subunit gamma/tau